MVDQQLLHDSLPQYARITWLESTGSTNADLLADLTAPPWTALLAGHQSAARGRLGRPWSAPAGTQLILSVLLHPDPADLDRLGTLPLAAGLAVTDVVEPAGLKWPNDALIDGRKLCGILAEATGLPERPRIVIGLGLNVSLTRGQLPVPHATSLALEGIHVTLDELAVDLLTALHHRLHQWHDDHPRLMADYRCACTSLGQRVRVELPAGDLIGDVTAITDDGRITVRTGDGEHHLSAGDVTHLRRSESWPA